MEEKDILWAIGKLKGCCHRDSPGDTDTTSTNSAPTPPNQPQKPCLGAGPWLPAPNLTQFLLAHTFTFSQHYLSCCVPKPFPFRDLQTKLSMEIHFSAAQCKPGAFFFFSPLLNFALILVPHFLSAELPRFGGSSSLIPPPDSGPGGLAATKPGLSPARGIL